MLAQCLKETSRGVHATKRERERGKGRWSHADHVMFSREREGEVVTCRLCDVPKREGRGGGHMQIM